MQGDMMKQTGMNNKIMISCIGAIIVIVLTSFTSVVGFQIPKSTLIKDTPLFSIRSRRATNRPYTRVINAEYIGKRKSINLQFPSTSTLLLFQRAIDGIKQMNDITFNKFLDTATKNLFERHKINREEIPQIKEFFQYLRDHADQVKYYPITEKLQEHLNPYTFGCHTILVYCYTFDKSPVFCFFLLVTFPIWYSIIILRDIYHYLTWNYNCKAFI